MKIKPGALAVIVVAVILVSFFAGLGVSSNLSRRSLLTSEITTVPSTAILIVPVANTINVNPSYPAYTITEKIVGAGGVFEVTVVTSGNCTALIPTGHLSFTSTGTVYVIPENITQYFNATIVTVTAYYFSTPTSTSTITISGTNLYETRIISYSDTKYTTTECATYS